MGPDAQFSGFLPAYPGELRAGHPPGVTGTERVHLAREVGGKFAGQRGLGDRDGQRRDATEELRPGFEFALGGAEPVVELLESVPLFGFHRRESEQEAEVQTPRRALGDLARGVAQAGEDFSGIPPGFFGRRGCGLVVEPNGAGSHGAGTGGEILELGPHFGEAGDPIGEFGWIGLGLGRTELGVSLGVERGRGRGRGSGVGGWVVGVGREGQSQRGQGQGQEKFGGAEQEGLHDGVWGAIPVGTGLGGEGWRFGFGQGGARGEGQEGIGAKREAEVAGVFVVVVIVPR